MMSTEEKLVELAAALAVERAEVDRLRRVVIQLTVERDQAIRRAEAMAEEVPSDSDWLGRSD